MNNDGKQKNTFMDWLVLVLYLCGMALVAAGLWQVSPPAASIYLGLELMVRSFCISRAAKSPERTVKK